MRWLRQGLRVMINVRYMLRVRVGIMTRVRVWD